MKQILQATCILLTVLLLMPFNSSGQNTVQKDSVNAVIKSAARDIMNGAATCALITLDEENIPVARTMDPFPPEDDFTVWFGTNPNSRKVEQIKNNPTVTLYYLKEDNSGYVVMHGKGQLVNDQKEKDARWKEEWEAFYPNNAEDYLLIKVSPEWMEVVSYAHGLVGDSVSWEAPVVIFDSKK